MSRCQSFECSWGLNVLLTLGNRSRPLSPPYRRGQRLCVLTCVGTGHVGTCPYDLYRSRQPASTRTQSTKQGKDTHTHTVLGVIAGHQGSRPIKQPLIDLPSNEWLTSVTLIIHQQTVLIEATWLSISCAAREAFCRQRKNSVNQTRRKAKPSLTQ